MWPVLGSGKIKFEKNVPRREQPSLDLCYRELAQCKSLVAPTFSVNHISGLPELKIQEGYLDVIEKRTVDVEIGHFGTPVVHFEINVGVFQSPF